MSRWVNSFIVLGVLLLAPRLGLAAEVRASLNRDFVTTAGRAVLTVSATAPIEYEVIMPSPPDELGGFKVAKRSSVERHRAPGAGFRHEIRFTLEPFLPGDYAIPALAIEITAPGAAAEILHTAPLTLPVHSVLGAAPDEAEMMDIVESISLHRIPWLQWIGGYVLLSTIILAVLLSRSGPPLVDTTTNAPTSLAERLDQLQQTNQPVPLDQLATLLTPTRTNPAYHELWRQLERYRFAETTPTHAEITALVQQFKLQLEPEGAPT